jgi:beta-galactosidase
VHEIVSGLAFGGDYNPEQWPAHVVDEDLELMQQAGVNLVTLGVFSWASYEPQYGRYEFGWLDRIMDRLHDIGIGVDLATPTAAPPPWLHAAHPEILPVTGTGQRYAPGGRLGWCPSSPIWREHVVRIVEVLARRYAAHPALRMWHVSNELGGGNRHCYCDVSAAHFRRWLRDRYGDATTLNDTWGTAFWGHRYADIDEVLPPRGVETAGNPGLVLDFDRFSSDALLEHLRAEVEVLRRQAPDVPVTTNLMIGTGPHVIDHERVVPDLDIVATDHYLRGDDPHRAHDVAWAADRTRGLRPDRPWLLMETAAGPNSWQRRNRPLQTGELQRTALTHVARGADGILFFQWRASVAGAEQFHSGMVPHAGPASRTWREVRALGDVVQRLAPLAGTVVEPARVALVVGEESAWAWEAGPKPHNEYPIAGIPRRWHRALWTQGVRSDVVPVSLVERGGLSDYDLVLVPALFMLRPSTARHLDDVVRRGARLVVSHLTGIVDETNRAGTGGHPALLRQLLGVRVEEFVPLWDGEVAHVEVGDRDTTWSASEWAEVVDVVDAEVVARYVDGPVAGGPAVTCRDGRAWYVSADFDDASLVAMVELASDGLGLGPVANAPPGLDVVRRRRVRASASEPAGGDRGERGTYVVAVNHTSRDLDLDVRGQELLTGRTIWESLVVPAGDVAVVREEAEQ